MPLFTIQNLLSSNVVVPDPVSKVLAPGKTITVSLTEEQVASAAFNKAITRGVIAIIAVADDPAVPAIVDGSPPEPMSRVVRVEDDFLTDQFPGQSNWSATGAGTGAIAAVVLSGSSLTGAAGVMGIAVSASGAATLYRQGSVMVPLGYGRMKLAMRNRASTSVPSGTEDYRLRFGLGNQVTAAGVPTVGLSLVFDRALSTTHWVLEKIFGGSTTNTVTPIAFTAGVWQTFEFDIDEDGDSAVISLGGVAQFSVDLSDVTKNENSVRFGPFYQIIKTAGSSQRSYFIDFVSFEKRMNRL